MSKPNRWHERLRPRAAASALWLLLAAAGLAFYAWGAGANPPGFFIDESSVAYNAHAVSEAGRDEHGEAWPLYFRAFGDYKNPTYVYLLAAVFRAAGLLTFLTALLTPWLFELSRVVVEVAAYPLAVALFLLAARRAASREAWGVADSALVAATLALVTYTYSTGRLFGPLLALGLALLVTKRRRVVSLLTTWALYGLALVPLYVYQ